MRKGTEGCGVEAWGGCWGRKGCSLLVFCVVVMIRINVFCQEDGDTTVIDQCSNYSYVGFMFLYKIQGSWIQKSTRTVMKEGRWEHDKLHLFITKENETTSSMQFLWGATALTVQFELLNINLFT